MADQRKQNIIGVLVDAIDYGATVSQVIAAAVDGRPMTVAALAVHGVMTSHIDREFGARVNSFDLVVPDGQPVRWAMNLIHRTALRERVYGPTLMLRVCDAAQRQGVGIYLYGSSEATVSRLRDTLQVKFPELSISGISPSRFRSLSPAEKEDVVDRIRRSGARVTFVGLGCPRQEIWAYEYREALQMPIIAVGAAFDFHAGVVKQAPAWMQAKGLEWLYRLRTEPRRLWRRYLLLNPWYLALVVAQRTRLRRFDIIEADQITERSYG
ncbi:MAG TPA: WecB/TagA/CpsF family glycosyltransferase [Thermomicrobiales bacterium]|nr:WecB/TagA/CpsF family glycosyltransferase [Thermomicrobiales bacterium]